jgi:hypothetical protein
VQRTPVNSECKLLLLTHAFESLEIVQLWSSELTSLTSKAGVRLNGWARSLMECSVTTKSHQTARSATLASTALSQVNGLTVKAHLRLLLNA